VRILQLGAQLGDWAAVAAEAAAAKGRGAAVVDEHDR